MKIEILLYLVVGFLMGGTPLFFMVQRLLKENKSLKEKNSELERELEQEREKRIIFQTQKEEIEKSFKEQLRTLERAEERLKESFKALSGDILSESQKSFLNMAKVVFEKSIEKTESTLKLSQTNIENIIKPLKEKVETYSTFLQDLEKKRIEEYGSLEKYLEELSKVNEKLRKETETLSKALSSSKSRGRWGEFTLKNLVKMAGMSEYCDFNEQVTSSGDSGKLVPDMIINLPDNRKIAIDSKVPFDSYLKAIETKDEKESEEYFKQHLKALKVHIDKLGKKEYQTIEDQEFDFVILFLPLESLFSEALKRDSSLIEYGVQRKVIIATPTTLLALLRTVAFTWKQQKMIENVSQIIKEGKELYSRLVKFSEHFTSLSKSIYNVNKSFNDAVRSWDSRVMPKAQKFTEFGLSDTSKEIKEIKEIDTLPLEPKRRE